jgi:hypothetical protein
MASEERFTVREWSVVDDDPDGLPKYAFENGTELRMELVEGRRANRFSWIARVPCSIEVPFDTQHPVVCLQYGERTIECTVDLSYDKAGLLHGELKYPPNARGVGDGNKGTFTADANNPPDPV